MKYREIVKSKLDFEALSEVKPSGGEAPLSPAQSRSRAKEQAKINQAQQAANVQHAQKLKSLALRASQL